MVQMDGSHESITLDEINEFQRKFNLKFTEQYTKFLLNPCMMKKKETMFSLSFFS